MALDIQNVGKRFGAFQALKGVSLHVAPGTFLALLGPSGSGKTTLLRILGGLAFADGGSVNFDGLDWLAIPARERRAGFVFQNYALFRHMTVAKNVAFGLDIRSRKERPSRSKIAARVEELLALVQLEGLGGRYPSQLSGGQRQRVALARALAIEPRLLLLDEPFGALDAKVRKDLRRWLRGLHEKMGITTVFVTHDQDEALDLADQVAIMNEGRIEQLGSPASIYDEPATAFAAEFLGGSNRFDGISDSGGVNIDGHTIHLAGEKIPPGPVSVFVRPHDIEILGADKRGVPGTIRTRLGAGPGVRFEILTRAGRLVEALANSPAVPFGPGDRVSLSLKRNFIFPAADRYRREALPGANVTPLAPGRRAFSLHEGQS